MKYMTLFRPTVEPAGLPTPEEQVALDKLIEEFKRDGVFVAIDGLASSASGALVRQTKGKLTVTDGPFAETKELVAGYMILDVKSKEHMIELTKRIAKILADDGVLEVRQVFDGS